MAYEIKFDKENCLGCGACTTCDNWEMKEGKAFPVKTRLDEIGCNQNAADICPAGVIKITQK